MLALGQGNGRDGYDSFDRFQNNNNHNNNNNDGGGSEDGGKLPLKSKWVSRWAKMALRRKDDDGDSLDEPGDFDDEF